MTESFGSATLQLDGRKRLVLRSDLQLAAEGQFAWPPAQGFFRADARDIGIIVVFGKMRQHQIARARVETFGIGEKRADALIREMAGAAHHALLDVPGIRADLEHLHIVIRFEHEAIAIAQVLLDQLGHVTEIGHQGELHAGSAEGEAERVDGVVGNAKRRDFDIANAEAVAGLNELDALESPRVALGKKTQRFGMSFGGEIYGGAPGGQQRGETADMIRMLVRDDDAVEAIDRTRQGGKPPQRCALSQPRIHQQARPGSLEQGAIARTARRENADAKADGFSPNPGLPLRVLARGPQSAKKRGRMHHRKSAGRASMRFKRVCLENFQQASKSRFSSKPSSGPTTVAAIFRDSKNSAAVCCTSSAVTDSIEACNSSTLKKRAK